MPSSKDYATYKKTLTEGEQGQASLRKKYSDYIVWLAKQSENKKIPAGELLIQLGIINQGIINSMTNPDLEPRGLAIKLKDAILRLKGKLDDLKTKPVYPRVWPRRLFYMGLGGLIGGGLALGAIYGLYALTGALLGLLPCLIIAYCLVQIGVSSGGLIHDKLRKPVENPNNEEKKAHFKAGTWNFIDTLKNDSSDDEPQPELTSLVSATTRSMFITYGERYTDCYLKGKTVENEDYDGTLVDLDILKKNIEHPSKNSSQTNRG